MQTQLCLYACTQQNSRGFQQWMHVANQNAGSNVVHKRVVALKVKWIVQRVHNTSLSASVRIKCAAERNRVVNHWLIINHWLIMT